MKNRAGLLETCLYILSFFSYVGAVFAIINYGELVSKNPAVSFLTVVVIPSIISISFGLAFHYCAKFIVKGSKKAWAISVFLLGVQVLVGLLTIYFIHFAYGILGTIIACVGLWAALQKATRVFVFE